ncbi:MAG TPA: protein kinase [Vicinamibacterales bacterium]|nr:protein kinase [Vicinamibacterales bacterium]
MNHVPNWDRVKQVFQAVLNLSPHQRTARARELCGDDQALLAEVESLLASHQQAGGFAERPAVELLNALPSEPKPQREESGIHALQVGDRLGVYQIQSLVGAGGMGEVYKARDSRLDRTVAIKVLPAHMGADQRARERFEREARAVAALSHPHICTLHDIGHQEGIDFLVLEHLNGQTLAERLAKGPLPLEQALDIAIQIASALDSAHRAGIVHRDLKPANVFLVRNGGASASPTAKLLDFGLAKGQDPVLAAGSSKLGSTPELTTPGAILGTVQYMAPEQLEGHGADTRTDIFAFGVVLYEMIAGRRPFEGGSQASVIAAILEHEPASLSSLRPHTPPTLDRIVSTCLAKNPDDRWQTARDLRRALTWLPDADGATRSIPVAGTHRLGRAALAGAVAVVGLASFAIYSSNRAPAPAAPNISFSIYPPEGTKFPRGTAEMAIAPDGGRLVFVALSSDGIRHLWIRSFDAVAARRLEGTDGASHPFWSPDGRSIGFFAKQSLRRIPEAGGSPQILCAVPVAGRGGAWNRDGTIIFGALNSPIRRMAETGGQPTPVTTLDGPRGERHEWPVFLPDGRRFLYFARRNAPEQTGVYQGSLDSTETHRVQSLGSNVGPVGTHLLSLSNHSLIAHAYDPDRAQVMGDPITVVERMDYDSLQRSEGAFSVAATGALAYRSASPDSHLIWIDRTGKEVAAFRAPGDYHHPWLSPGEQRVAVERTDASTGRHTIWILELERGVTNRLVSDETGAHMPVWSPDGNRVLFSSNRNGGTDLYWIRADGAGRDELVLRTDGIHQVPTDWSLDGRFLLYEARPHSRGDLWILPVSPVQKPQPFLEAAASQERQGQFSPDMRWIAYTSDESGTYEVYVRRYPGADLKWQVSTHGGAQPRWRRDGKEVFYLAPDGNLMATAVTEDRSRFETGTPQALFNTGITASSIDRRNQYVVTPDGRRFLVNISAEDENAAPITVVLNWNARLKK